MRIHLLILLLGGIAWVESVCDITNNVNFRGNLTACNGTDLCSVIHSLPESFFIVSNTTLCSDGYPAIRLIECQNTNGIPGKVQITRNHGD